MAIFLAVCAAIVPYIPIVLQLAGWALQFFGASKENLAAYQDMIQKNKDSGLISVDTYVKLTDFHAKMKLEAEEAAKKDKPQV